MEASIDFDMNVLKNMRTQAGQSLLKLSFEQPVMLVFLRHFGCTFCREALDDLSRQREDLAALGSRLVLVHMSDNPTAEKYFHRYRLNNIDHISDPECKFYAAFNLAKGSLTQLFGLRSWIRGFEAGVLDGHGIGWQIGDGFQMPGIFIIQDGEVKESFIHKAASSRPDYIGLVRSCCDIN